MTQDVTTKIVHLTRTAAICAESEMCDGLISDTAVHIESPDDSVRSVLLCWVSGAERDEFLSELAELIERYRI